jgi:hypothetical protein
MHERDKVQTVQQSLGRIARRQRKELFMSEVSDAIIKFLWAAIPTFIIGNEAIKHTMSERGYFAIGGEWILIVAVFMITCKILDIKKANQERWSARRKAIIPSSTEKIKERGL